MANDKNPREQLRNRQPQTHSERSFAAPDAAPGNPWDAMQQDDERWTRRAQRQLHFDWATVVVLAAMAAAAVVLALLLK